MNTRVVVNSKGGRMFNQLNDAFNRGKLRILDLEKFRQYVIEIIEKNVDEPIEEELFDVLDSEIDRRLEKSEKADEQKILKELSERLLLHQFTKEQKNIIINKLPTLKRKKHDDDDDDFGGGMVMCMCSVPGGNMDDNVTGK
jgi:hypothetical protein